MNSFLVYRYNCCLEETMFHFINKNDKLEFKVHHKTNNRNDYIHYFSNHSDKIKRCVLIGSLQRALGICSPNHLNNKFDYLIKSFSKFQYPDPFILHTKLKTINIHKHTWLNKTKNSQLKSNSNTMVKEKYTVLPQNPTISFIENNLNCLGIKMITQTSKTIRQPLGSNNDNKTKSYSNAGIYRIWCQDCPRYYIGETSRNLPN